MATMVRPPDPFKPPVDAAYTNGEVNRAGQLLRRWYLSSEEQTPEDLGTTFDDLVDAMVAVTWWRGLHARPLSRVAANLRYHVAAEGGQVDGRVDVTQRLKRRPTIFNKLEREPTMQLTQMQDIGGVRARLPSLTHVYAVSRRLRKTWTIIRTKDYVKDPRSSGYRGDPPRRSAQRSSGRGPAADCSPGCLGQPGRGRQPPARHRLQVRRWRGGSARLLPSVLGSLRRPRS